jgi:hypothetical protein
MFASRTTSLSYREVPANRRQAWKYLPGTNTLAYFELSIIKNVNIYNMAHEINNIISIRP